MDRKKLLRGMSPPGSGCRPSTACFFLVAPLVSVIAVTCLGTVHSEISGLRSELEELRFSHDVLVVHLAQKLQVDVSSLQRSPIATHFSRRRSSEGWGLRKQLGRRQPDPPPPELPTTPEPHSVQLRNRGHAMVAVEEPQQTDPPASDVTLPELDLGGEWHDGRRPHYVVQKGSRVAAKLACGATEEGRVNADQIFMFQLAGALHPGGAQISWTNGVVWRKVSHKLPPDVDLELPKRGKMPRLPSGSTCPGGAPHPVASRSRNPFYLCTHGPDDMISRVFEQSGWWQDCISLVPIIALLKEAHPGEDLRVVEVGGNIGACAWVMATEGAQVTSFEPAPANYRLFRASNRFNKPAYGGRVRLIPKGAGDSIHAATIKSEAGNFGNSVLETRGSKVIDLFDGRRSAWGERAMVNITTIDAEVKHAAHFLKLDCQGHELDALRGAKDFLSLYGTPLIRTEFDQKFLIQAGHEPIDLLKVISDYGYTIVHDGKELTPAMFEKFVEDHQELDLYAVKPDIIPESKWCYLRGSAF